MSYHIEFFKKIQNLEPTIRDALLALLEEIENTVTKSEFNELKEIVKELAIAQNKTEQRLNELAKAQQKTEERLNELAKAQKRTEERLDSLTQKVEQLAEAQQKTEKRLNELAKAQQKTEERLDKLTERVEQLAKAQQKTEEELKKLVGEHRKTREMLGGLSHTVGYILEDRAYKGLPKLIEKDFGISIIEPFKRKFIPLGHKKYVEINIIGKGRKNEKEYIILGECKTQLKKKDIDRFLKTLEKIKYQFPEEKKFIFVTYQTSPEVESYIKEKNLKLYYSYELPL